MRKLFKANKGEKLESVSVWISTYSDVDELYEIMKTQIEKFGPFCLTFDFYKEDLEDIDESTQG